MSAPGSPDADDLVGDLIAEVARTHGIAISRDDPVIAVVLLNQVVLRRYLEEAVAPATAATREAVAEIEQLAQAQARWLEQVSLKDRATFLEEQKELHEAWKEDMEALIQGQNGALRDVVFQTVARLRGSAGTGPVPAAPTPTATLHTSRCGAIPDFRAWRWLAAGVLLGLGATLAVTMATWNWLHIVSQ